MSILGLVSIGQSPRPDYEQAFRPYAPDAEIRVVGALDGMTPHEVDVLTQHRKDYPLLVKLANGHHVEIELSVLHPLVERQARHMADTGAALVVVMCAGGFPDVTCNAPVLLPGQILPAVVGAMSRTRRIGIVTPVQGQVDSARQKWQDDGFEPKVTWASPYDQTQMTQAAGEMADSGLEVVVLDCMGHDDTYRQTFARLCGRPTVLAQSLVARVAGEWVA